MNFEIFDDEFEQDKPSYLEEIQELSNQVVEPKHKERWEKFVEENLVSTRNYYLIITALKVMKNLNDGQDFEMALVSALAFMPDFTFLETVVILVGIFHAKGEEFAKHHKVDIKPYQKKNNKYKNKLPLGSNSDSNSDVNLDENLDE